MTEPTYRIETTHEPKYTGLPWSAHVYRVTDDAMVFRGDGSTEGEAVSDALAAIARMNAAETGSTFYATETGKLLDAPAAVTPDRPTFVVRCNNCATTTEFSGKSLFECPSCRTVLPNRYTLASPPVTPESRRA